MGRQRSAKGGTGRDSAGTKGERTGKSRPSAAQTGSSKAAPARTAKARSAQGIPPAVANRMVRRIALATGVPTLLGIGVFVVSYLLVSKGLLDVPPGVTLACSGALFLLGLVGLSYGVFSASWEETPGSLFGFEQISVNLSRLRASGGRA